MFKPEKRILKTGNIEYTIRYSGRRTHGISISPDKGVVARVPYRTPDREIEKMIRAKSAWITKVLAKQRSHVRLDPERFGTGEQIIYRGKKCIMKLLASDRYYVRKLNEDIIEIGFNGRNDSELIKVMLEAWYKMVARRVFPQRFAEILSKCQRYGFVPTGFSVRTMKKRWGSCTSGGRIAISYDLIRLDDIYTEYVIIHELCHLKHHDHGPGFYRLLAEVFPDWKATREALRRVVR